MTNKSIEELEQIRKQVYIVTNSQNVVNVNLNKYVEIGSVKEAINMWIEKIIIQLNCLIKIKNIENDKNRGISRHIWDNGLFRGAKIRQICTEPLCSYFCFAWMASNTLIMIQSKLIYLDFMSTFSRIISIHIFKIVNYAFLFHQNKNEREIGGYSLSF